MVPGAASAERHEQATEGLSDHTKLGATAVKQTAITDFFSPRPSEPIEDVPVFNGLQSGRKFATPPFITPCPSVRLAEVPAVFQLQAECVVEDYFDPTRPLFEREISKSSSEPSSVETASSPAKVGLESPSPKAHSPVITWQNRSVSDSPNDPTLYGSPGQGSGSSSPSVSGSSKEVPPKTTSSPPATEHIGTSQVEDADKDDAQANAEDFWMEKDKERLEVIANMEKTMAEMEGKLDNTATAFQMASDANHKLQAEFEKKKVYLSQAEEDTDHLVHNLNAAEMNNEQLEKELARSQRDRQYQFDRAEEALLLLAADPTKISVAKILQDKNEAASQNMLQQREMESEIDGLNSQLKERCNSVARLTETVSRVADSDRWKDIKKEMEDLKIRANQLPEELQAAWLECEKWKVKYDSLSEKHEKLVLEHASLEEKYRKVKEFDLKSMQELKRNLMNKAATSQRVLKGCIKRVFERMWRCSLFLETEGFLPFNNEHQTICDEVSELTGEDYQQALNNYYDEHDIRQEFNIYGEGDEEEGDQQGDDEDDYRGDDGGDDGGDDEDWEDDGKDDGGSEGGQDLSNAGQMGNGEPSRPENDKEHDQGYTGNDGKVDPHTSDFAVGPTDTPHDASSAPAPVTTEDANVVSAAAKEAEIQSSLETQAARSERQVSDTGKELQAETDLKTKPVPEDDTSSIKVLKTFPATADSASPARTSTFDAALEQGAVSSIGEGPTQAPETENAAVPQTNEGDVRDESFEDVKGTEGVDDKVEDVFDEETNVNVVETPNNAVSEGNGGGLSHETMYREPAFESKPAEALDPSTLAGDSDRPSAFGTGTKSPSPSLLATPFADSTAKLGERIKAPNPFGASTPAAFHSSSTTSKDNGQNIWKDISFANPGNNPFAFSASSAADLGAKRKQKSPVLKPLSVSKSTEAKAPVFELPGAKQGNESTEAQKGVPAIPKEALCPPRLQDFNFGGNTSPVSFTASSTFFPTQKTQPTSTGMFSSEKEIPPSVTIRPEEYAAEDGVAKGGSSEEDVSKVEDPKDKATEKKALHREETPAEKTPKEAPSPSEPSRSQKRAAKKQQEKAVKKAKQEARNAKTQASRRVQQAMMMR